jgi:formylmethanofuran dehydrogenase subunit C
MLEIHAAGESCLCDFTFDFYWQHQGSRLDPDRTIDGLSFRQLVQALQMGETIRIRGDAGNRLGSSLGVDLVRLGGKGGPMEATGKIVVDGDVGNRMGISMLRGAIYVSGQVLPPLGNAIETETDLSGYRKFISITEALEKGVTVREPNSMEESRLVIRDGILRETLGARNRVDKAICVDETGMSTGILMRAGLIDISSCSGNNTGVLLSGGRIVVRGSTGDFTGAEMRKGEIIVGKSAGSFACARMRGGSVYAREGKAVAPAKERMLSPAEQKTVAKALGLSPLYAMMYKRIGL